jgi:hypothetical protein
MRKEDWLISFSSFLRPTYANNPVQRVSSRANKIETIPIPIRMKQTKEYSDAYTQYEASEFVASSSSQTELEPVTRRASLSIQTKKLLSARRLLQLSRSLWS